MNHNITSKTEKLKQSIISLGTLADDVIILRPQMGRLLKTNKFTTKDDQFGCQHKDVF